MRLSAVGLITIAVAAAAFAPAAIADEHSEIVQAETHAGLAAQATDISAVHMHLHHTLNCLAGPNGMGFDAKEMNPCANAGSGAIPDAKSDTAKTDLQTAAAEANAGIVETDLKKAQDIASKVAAMLKKDE